MELEGLEIEVSILDKWIPALLGCECDTFLTNVAYVDLFIPKCGWFVPVFRNRKSFYVDPDPGSGSGFRSRSKGVNTKEEKLH